MAAAKQLQLQHSLRCLKEEQPAQNLDAEVASLQAGLVAEAARGQEISAMLESPQGGRRYSLCHRTACFTPVLGDVCMLL